MFFLIFYDKNVCLCELIQDELGSLKVLSFFVGDGQRKKSKTEEDSSYHSAEVSPRDRGQKKS